MKICNECGIEKSLNQYPKHKDTKDGHLSKCKSCVSMRRKEYQKEYHKNYRRKIIEGENTFSSNNTTYTYINDFICDIKPQYYGAIIDGKALYKLTNDEFIELMYGGDYSWIFVNFTKWRNKVYLDSLVKGGIEFNKNNNI